MFLEQAIGKINLIRIGVSQLSLQRGTDVSIHDGNLAEQFVYDVYDVYDGDDLGVTYHPEGSFFRVWAPTASKAEVVLYLDWSSVSGESYMMHRDQAGTFVCYINQNLRNYFYTYKVWIGEQCHEAVDPYAVAVGVNGDRGAIVELEDTNPMGWKRLKRDSSFKPVDAVIYELHIRDASYNPNSGMSPRGKYTALAQPGTKGPYGIKTGLDYIKALGVTHVQLLPIFDYATESVDETKLEQPHYNWGYDPKNYNAPEGSYSTNPYGPEARIRELKLMIHKLHSKGISVIMDVVYNHIFDVAKSSFNKLAPGYYFRHLPDGSLSNGSFCGNECASEMPMMSKFIVDSVLYWAKEYHLDGFRFDLMGLLDIATMNEIRRRLDEIDPSIIMLGEGWNLPTVLPENKRAAQRNSSLLPRIGQFSDLFRDAIKGSNFDVSSKGFIHGEEGLEASIKSGIVGGIKYNKQLSGFASEPDQTVNYVECHDNLTLWDKLVASCPNASEADYRKLHRLASAILLTSQGIPFFHAGQEFMRTKQGVENSYNSPAELNALDWQRCAQFGDDVAYMQSLISLRKSHPAFRLRTSEEIRNHLFFEMAPSRSVAYTLRDHAGGDWDLHLYVIYNANTGPITVELPHLGYGAWKIRYGSEHVVDLKNHNLHLDGIGMVVLAFG